MWRRGPALFLPVVYAGAVFLASATSRADEKAPSPSTKYDCGTLALYTLLKLEKRPVDLAAFESRLPTPTPRGYSMRQLRDGARAFGLELIGVRLSKREGTLDRPALVFLKQGSHGHFVVIRPVGQTGKLIQILDSNHVPDVIDARDLYGSSEWTGLALIPDRTNWPIRALVLLLLVTASLVLAQQVACRCRSLSQSAP